MHPTQVTVNADDEGEDRVYGAHVTTLGSYTDRKETTVLIPALVPFPLRHRRTPDPVSRDFCTPNDGTYEGLNLDPPDSHYLCEVRKGSHLG